MTLLQHPVFRRLYAAHIVHIIGNEFTFIAVFGLLDIPLGIGGVLAGLAAGRLAERLSERGIARFQGWALIAMGLSIVAVFHIKPLLGLAVAILFCSFASFGSSILSVTKLQKLAAPAYLARVFSIREMATMGAFRKLSRARLCRRASGQRVCLGLARHVRRSSRRCLAVEPQAVAEAGTGRIVVS